MRVRWLALVVLLGMIAAWIDHSTIEAYITVFGGLILYALRQVHGSINALVGSSERSRMELINTSEIMLALRDALPPQKVMPDIFAGDKADQPTGAKSDKAA